MHTSVLFIAFLLTPPPPDKNVAARGPDAPYWYWRVYYNLSPNSNSSSNSNSNSSLNLNSNSSLNLNSNSSLNLNLNLSSNLFFCETTSVIKID